MGGERKGWGRAGRGKEGKEEGKRREGGKRRGSSHAFCFSNNWQFCRHCLPEVLNYLAYCSLDHSRCRPMYFCLPTEPWCGSGPRRARAKF